MEAKIIHEKEAPLLNRREVSLELNFPGVKTPTKAEVVKKASELLKTEENLIEFQRITPTFGLSKCKALVHVYKDINELTRIERKKKKPKKAVEAARKKK